RGGRTSGTRWWHRCGLSALPGVGYGAELDEKAQPVPSDPDADDLTVADGEVFHRPKAHGLAGGGFAVPAAGVGAGDCQLGGDAVTGGDKVIDADVQVGEAGVELADGGELGRGAAAGRLLVVELGMEQLAGRVVASRVPDFVVVAPGGRRPVGTGHAVLLVPCGPLPHTPEPGAAGPMARGSWAGMVVRVSRSGGPAGRSGRRRGGPGPAAPAGPAPGRGPAWTRSPRGRPHT